MTRRTRILLSVTLGLIAWFAVTVVWASRPLSDSVPIGKDAAGKIVVAEVRCNTVFDGSAMDASNMPTIVNPDDAPATGTNPVIVQPIDAPNDWEFPREPCSQVHSEARLLFGINVAVFVLGLAALGFVASRTRPRALPQMTAAAA